MKWWNEFNLSKVKVHSNLTPSELIEHAVAKGVAKLSTTGALVFNTGKFTGRAANDKYVVVDPYSVKHIDWSNNINKISRDDYLHLRQKYIKDLKHQAEAFMMERSACADERFSLGLRIITPNPVQALFFSNMFREKKENNPLGTFTVFHAPNLEINPQDYNVKSPTVIAINLKAHEILIIGTLYSGEIKKAVFSVLNTLLLDHKVLPMHAGANIDEQGNACVFFGLSGTGKTTLSTDVGKKLIGDDEIGFSKEGLFNFEGGCYAKTYKLSFETEPQIFKASTQFGALLENVVMNENRQVDFNDKSITENGRASYPVNFIDDFVSSGKGPVPKNIFFLSADATGVLPAVSYLTEEQITYYFLSGYTAKLGGTELGVQGVQLAFSHCFGAPFMMRNPQEYAKCLIKHIRKHKINVWLINTGWSGGGYGTGGERFSLKITRAIIRSIQKGELNRKSKFTTEPYFNLKIPVNVPGIKPQMFNPKLLWKNPQEYEAAASKLKHEFEKNFKKFSSNRAQPRDVQA